MATVQFQLDTRGKGARPIILRFTHQYKSFRNAKIVGLRVPASNWDFDAKGSPESIIGKEQWAVEARAHLAELHFRLTHKIPIALRAELGRDPAMEEIRERILSEENLLNSVKGRRTAPKMLGLREEYLDHCEKRDHAPATIRAKQTFFHRLSSFFAYKKLDPFFDAFNLPMYFDLIWYLRHEYVLASDGKTKGLSDKSVGTVVKDLKAYMNWAALAGYSKNQIHNHPEFKKPDADADTTALNLDEIWAIIRLKLPDRIRDRSALETARDVMVVGMMTGLRISDLLTMERHHVHLDHVNPSNSMIRLRTKKGLKKIEAPIHPEAFKVFAKYEDQPEYALPRHVPGGVHLTEQFFNRLIKEVARHAGIVHNEETRIVISGGKMDRVNVVPRYTRITAHSLRRTFVTRLHAAGVSEIIIRRLSGHSTGSREAHQAYVMPSYKEQYEIVVRAFGLK